jgi:hypothetical protein
MDAGGRDTDASSGFVGARKQTPFYAFIAYNLPTAIGYLHTLISDVNGI